MSHRLLVNLRSVFHYLTLVGLLIGVSSTKVLAQPTTTGASYKSEIDELMTIKTVSVLPFSDNTQGIYARPLESHLTDVIGKMHRWDLRPVNSVGPILSPEDLEDDLEKAKSMAGGITADAFIAARISKGPNGISLVLSLFLTKDAKLLAKATLKDSRIFDLGELKKEIEVLLAKVTAQIPYQGTVLSRDNQRVTVNLGKRDGVQPQQILSVIQLVSVTRHPKFNFIINSDKEIIGRIKVLKVDDTLSFGVIVSEKEKGVIQKGNKIAGLEFVKYATSDSLDDASGGKDIADRADAPVAFGENPSAWLPTKTPTFGEISARFGDALYSSAMSVNGLPTLSSSTYLAPSVFIDGAIWITSSISVHAGFKQGIIPVNNPRSGSTPNEMNQSLSRYELMFGYNFRLGENIWGPSVEVLLGYMNYRLYVDNTTPLSYTTMTYSGYKTGLSGYLPVTADKKWGAGAEIFMVFKPHLKETPLTSGASSSNSVNMFGIFGYKKIRENIKLIGKLEFEQYTTSFSGVGSRTEVVTTSSQRHTTLSGGLTYMF